MSNLTWREQLISAFSKGNFVILSLRPWRVVFQNILAAQKEGEKLKLPSAIDLHKKLVAQGKI